MASWHTIESARDQWPDAPVDYEDGGDDTLTGLLAVAKEAVVAFAPAGDYGAPDAYTITSVAPDVATLTLSPSDGLVMASVIVDGTAAFAAPVIFELPDEYIPADYMWATSRDGRISVSPGGGGITGLAVTALAGAAGSVDMTWKPYVAFGDVPESYRTAQLMHARNVWNSSKASPSGDFDSGSYGLSSFPLDWQVRQLIRPKRGLPVIG